MYGPPAELIAHSDFAKMQTIGITGVRHSKSHLLLPVTQAKEPIAHGGMIFITLRMILAHAVEFHRLQAGKGMSPATNFALRPAKHWNADNAMQRSEQGLTVKTSFAHSKQCRAAQHSQARGCELCCAFEGCLHHAASSTVFGSNAV